MEEQHPHGYNRFLEENYAVPVLPDTNLANLENIPTIVMQQSRQDEPQTFSTSSSSTSTSLEDTTTITKGTFLSSSWRVRERKESMLKVVVFDIQHDTLLAPQNNITKENEFLIPGSPFSSPSPSPTAVKTLAPKETIPKVIHICWRNGWLSNRMYHDILVENMKMTKGFDHRFYTNQSIMEFIKINFPPIVLESYLMINPQYGACLSDFFRYCVLYVYGGVYIDIKSRITAPLENLWKELNDQLLESDQTDLLVVSHWPMASQHGIQARELNHREGEIMNWVIVCSKGHPFMKSLIDNMVVNIQAWKKYRYMYGEKINVLRLTGPIFLTRMILNELKENPKVSTTGSIRIHDILNQYFNYSTVTSKTSIVFDTRIYHDSGITHYSQLSDPIILFGSEVRPHIFFFPKKADDTGLSALETFFMTTSSEEKGASSFETFDYDLKPIVMNEDNQNLMNLNDTTSNDVIVLLKNVFQTMGMDQETSQRAFETYVSWKQEKKKSLLRYAYLYDKGGYFIDSSLTLSKSPAWDLYVRQVDCVLCIYAPSEFDVAKNRDPVISPLFMKFPAGHELLKAAMMDMIVITDRSYNRTDASHDRFQKAATLLRQRSNPNSKIISLGQQHNINNNNKSTTLLVVSIRPLHKVWTELPENFVPMNSHTNVIEFAGFPIATF